VTIRVLHLVGSAVSEFLADLSRLYATDCIEAVSDPTRYEFHIAYVTPDGRWRFPADLRPESIEAAAALPVAEAILQVSTLRCDVVVPQMFCTPGMTSYRALFDVLGVPYLGNTAAVMALGADKVKAKAVVAAAGVRVPAGEVLRRGQQPTMVPPVVVKPAAGDNSFGVTLVREQSEYAAALDSAFEHGDEVLVETFIELGREVRCGVLERDGELVCLPLEEYNVDPVSKPIRSYDDKISRGSEGDLRLVAKEATKAWVVDPGDPITEVVWDAARRCHQALGCRHYSLFDFRVDTDGQPFFLEAGLYCSFAEQSVISVMAKAAGIPLRLLFESAIQECLREVTPTGS
jgi:D-alanine-D-alanine ligase